jgi:DNA primase
MENDEPVMDWFTFGGVPVEVASTVVLVEDQISAMRVLCDTGIISVALLGTGMNDEKVAEIQRHASNILIALDADATGQSFSIARKWGQAFNQCKVVILRNDIKDSTNEEVRAIFGPYTS